MKRATAWRGLLGTVAVVVLIAGAVATRPYWDSAHYKWTLDPHGQTLSIKSQTGNYGSKFEPTLTIDCAHGHPNVTMAPIQPGPCLGDCTVGGSSTMMELFLVDRSLISTLRVSANDAPNAPYTQDVLSNPPQLRPGAAETAAGKGQVGSWWVPANSLRASRFDYTGDPAGDVKVDQQARNYINRLAASKQLQLDTEASPIWTATFDTRDLASKLPKFWALCPAPDNPAG
jgi:hypothetical protein